MRWALLAFLLLAAVSLPGPAVADEVNHAGLVILFDDGRIKTQCIAFEEGEIAGVDLLTRSGLELVMDTADSLGVTVCQIEGEGCAFPADPCFCQCMGGGECAYWNYFYRDPGETGWNYSALGALVRKVKPGSVEAWVWGDGQTPPADDLTFEAICLPPAPMPAIRTEPTRSGPSPARGEEQASAPSMPAVVAAATTVMTASIADPVPTEPPLALPSPTFAPPAPTPSAVPATDTDPNLVSYWPFGLMVLGLAVMGAIVWLRRT